MTEIELLIAAMRLGGVQAAGLVALGIIGVKAFQHLRKALT